MPKIVRQSDKKWYVLIQAFLQRIVNGGGRIKREYGLGRMRTDILVIWQVTGQNSDGRQQITEGIGNQSSATCHPAKSTGW